MSATCLDVFDRTIHLTNVWLDEIMTTLPRDRQLAWHALGAVLRTVRDRVPLNLAVHLGAQLPLLCAVPISSSGGRATHHELGARRRNFSRLCRRK